MVKRRQKIIGAFGTALACVVFFVAAERASEPSALEVVNVHFSNGSVARSMPIATTKAQQAQGLKGLEDVGRGMLFLWPEPNSLYFWMQDTPQPLTLAFFNDEYRITAIVDMQPFSEERHYSPGPALGAIEMPQGWFATVDVQPGMTFALEHADDP